MRSPALILTLSVLTAARPVRAEPPAVAPAPASLPGEPAALAPAVAPAAPAGTPPAPPAASPQTQPPQPPSPPPLPVDHSFVHLGSNYAGAQLELKSSVDQGEWRAVCIAPCDVAVPVAAELARVTAVGMTSSNTFRIEPGQGTALIRVDGGSAQARSLGITGLFVGIPTAVAGMALFGYGKLEEQDGARIAGTVVLATGAVILVASLPLLVIGSTKVRDAHGSIIAETLRTGQARF